MAVSSDFAAHLASARTTICRAWALVRRDGIVHGFTDHDRDLTFEGVTFKADTGLTAQALEQSTGLSVDNTEALGALSDASVREDDIRAGRYDGAEVRAWLVNWADVTQRQMQFRGTIGEITRSGPAFKAELRGLAERLNQPQGRAFQKPCSAILGDGRCGVDLSGTGLSVELAVQAVENAKVLRFDAGDLAGFADRWFERGQVQVISGAGVGLAGPIKNDRLSGSIRTIEVWQSLRAPLAIGDLVRLVAGCDKRTETCSVKFNNIINFQGFPHIPGDDWLMSVPRQAGNNSGGAL